MCDKMRVGFCSWHHCKTWRAWQPQPKRLYDYIFPNIVQHIASPLTLYNPPVSGLEDYFLSFQSLTGLKRRYYIRPTFCAWSCAANPCHGEPAGVRAATRASLPEQHSPDTTPSARSHSTSQPEEKRSSDFWPPPQVLYLRDHYI